MFLLHTKWPRLWFRILSVNLKYTLYNCFTFPHSAFSFYVMQTIRCPCISFPLNIIFFLITNVLLNEFEIIPPPYMIDWWWLIWGKRVFTNKFLFWQWGVLWPCLYTVEGFDLFSSWLCYALYTKYENPDWWWHVFRKNSNMAFLHWYTIRTISDNSTIINALIHAVICL